MRISQATLRAAILTAVVATLPIPCFGQRGYFGGEGSRRVVIGNDGGEGGPGVESWLPGLLEGGRQLLEGIGQDEEFFEDDMPQDDYVPPRPRPRRPPADQPRPNKLPPKSVEVTRNLPFTPLALTAADIANAKDQVKDEISADRDDLKKLLPTAAETETFLQGKGLSPADAKKVASEMESGFLSPQSEALITGLGLPAADQAKLDAVLGAHQQINAATEAAISGKLTDQQLNDLATSLGPFVTGNATASNTANDLLNSLGTAGGLMQMLDAAQAGLNSVPGGGNVLLGLIPGLPPGTVIPLGPNMALLGSSLLGGGTGPQIMTGSVAQGLGLPVGSNPVPESEGKLLTEGVYLVNRTEAEVNYVLNGKSYTMQPGYSQTLAAGTTWTVSFDKGNDQGTARYTLESGTYAFTASDAGWDLFKESFAVTIDNSRSSFEFNYVLNNQAMVVAAGATKDHTSAYPLQIRYDAGNGKTKQKRLEKGTFVVGLAADDNSLELYAGVADGDVPTPTGTGSGLNLFGRTPTGSGSGAVNLFGPSASSDNAPWRRTQFFGGSSTTGDEGSSFLNSTPSTTGAGTPPAASPTRTVKGAISAVASDEVAPAPAPAP